MNPLGFESLTIIKEENQMSHLFVNQDTLHALCQVLHAAHEDKITQ